MEFYKRNKSYLKTAAIAHIIVNTYGLVPSLSGVFSAIVEFGAWIFLARKLVKDGVTRQNVLRLLLIPRFKLRRQKERRCLGRHLLELLLLNKVGTNTPPIQSPFFLLKSLLKHGPQQRHKIHMDAQRQYGDTYCTILPFKLGKHSLGTMLCNTSNAQEIEKVMTDKETFPSRTPKGFKFDVKEGMLFYETGEKWALHRKIVTQFLTEKNLAKFANVTIKDKIEVLMKKWEERDGVAEFQHDFSLLTYEIISSFVTGLEVAETENQRIAKEDFRTTKIVDYVTKWGPVVALFPDWFPLPMRSKLRQLLAESDAGLRETIEKSKDIEEYSPNEPISMLSAMKDATLDDGSLAMSEHELLEEMGTMLGAGHETTSNTLCWAMLLLARNPIKLKTLQKEVDSVVHGDIPTFDEIKRLPYSHMVIYEALRLFPTVPALVDQGPLNKDPSRWPSPEEFIPERFKKLPELRMSKPIGAPNGEAFGFMPFGAGQRTCIGQRFAMYESVQILASIVKNYSWELDSSPVIEVSDITLGPKLGLKAKVKRREKSPT